MGAVYTGAGLRFADAHPPPPGARRPSPARLYRAARVPHHYERARRPSGPAPWRPILKPRITVITLGVDDLERAVAFYRDGLGLPTRGIVGTEFEHGAVAFFELTGGLRLALWPRASLAHDSGLAIARPAAPDVSVGHNVASRAEVDDVMKAAARTGAAIVKAAHDTFWGGYSGYFQDPDGHLWEVTWNPAWAAELEEADA